MTKAPGANRGPLLTSGGLRHPLFLFCLPDLSHSEMLPRWTTAQDPGIYKAIRKPPEGGLDNVGGWFRLFPLIHPEKLQDLFRGWGI